jgi:hypothetical protein
MNHWRVGCKVFETEEEARQYAKDMMSLGALVGISKTTDDVTHRYVFDNFARTEEL